jgi:hypothetical protein
MRTLLPRGVFGVVLSLVVAAACGYDPMPQDGMLKCGSGNSCPDNYSCMSGRCWRNGAGGTGGSNSRGGSGGSGGSMGSGGSSPADKFIGTWTFDAPNTTRVRVCTDGTNETMHPYADAFDVTAGSGGVALLADFYCPWNLDLNAAGTTTVIRSGQSCSRPDPNTPTTMFTWRGETFTFMTTDGSTGTADISLPYSYTTSTGSGSCTMHFTGPVTK